MTKRATFRCTGMGRVIGRCNRAKDSEKFGEAGRILWKIAEDARWDERGSGEERRRIAGRDPGRRRGGRLAAAVRATGGGALPGKWKETREWKVEMRRRRAEDIPGMAGIREGREWPWGRKM